MFVMKIQFDRISDQFQNDLFWMTKWMCSVERMNWHAVNVRIERTAISLCDLMKNENLMTSNVELQ